MTKPQNNNQKIPYYWKTTFAITKKLSFLGPETQMTLRVPICFQDLLQNGTTDKTVSNKSQSNKDKKKIFATVTCSFKEELVKRGSNWEKNPQQKQQKGKNQPNKKTKLK